MTDVVMPQMGESIVEGTLTKWLKKVGDRVRKEEPLVEIQTDKINVEIPSPAEGVLESIAIAESAKCRPPLESTPAIPAACNQTRHASGN